MNNLNDTGINLNGWTITELKALMYDLLLQQNRIQQDINIVLPILNQKVEEASKQPAGNPS